MDNWDKKVNEILNRTRHGVQLCDLMGEDADTMETLKANGFPPDVIEDMLAGGAE